MQVIYLDNDLLVSSIDEILKLQLPNDRAVASQCSQPNGWNETLDGGMFILRPDNQVFATMLSDLQTGKYEHNHTHISSVCTHGPGPEQTFIAAHMKTHDMTWVQLKPEWFVSKRTSPKVLAAARLGVHFTGGKPWNNRYGFHWKYDDCRHSTAVCWPLNIEWRSKVHDLCGSNESASCKWLLSFVNNVTTAETVHELEVQASLSKPKRERLQQLAHHKTVAARRKRLFFVAVSAVLAVLFILWKQMSYICAVCRHTAIFKSQS